MTRNDEIRRLLDTLLATRTGAIDPSMRDRAREDAAMRLACDCDELLGSIVPTLLEENEEQARRIDALMAFAARCQRAHATPGCEREPVKMAYLDLLASRIETTADAREEQARRIEGLAEALRNAEDEQCLIANLCDHYADSEIYNANRRGASALEVK